MRFAHFRLRHDQQPHCRFETSGQSTSNGIPSTAAAWHMTEWPPTARAFETGAGPIGSQIQHALAVALQSSGSQEAACPTLRPQKRAAAARRACQK